MISWARLLIYHYRVPLERKLSTVNSFFILKQSILPHKLPLSFTDAGDAAVLPDLHG